MIRIAVADDHVLFCSGLQMLLDAEPGLEFAGAAHDGEAAVELVRREAPDVLLLDVRMPLLDGISATRRIARDPDVATRVVILTTHQHDSVVAESLAAGAAGFLMKDATTELLLGTVRAVAAGRTVVAGGGQHAPLRDYAPPAVAARPEVLSARGALGPREGGVRLGRAGPEHRRDRGGGAPERVHHQKPRLEHPRQARPRLPPPARRLRAPPRSRLTRGAASVCSADACSVTPGLPHRRCTTAAGGDAPQPPVGDVAAVMNVLEENEKDVGKADEYRPTQAPTDQASGLGEEKDPFPTLVDCGDARRRLASSGTEEGRCEEEFRHRFRRRRGCADSSRDGAPPPSAVAAEGHRPSALVTPVSIEQTDSSYQELADQITELVSAYDRPANRFDPGKVSAETLHSAVGRAFVSAVSGQPEAADAPRVLSRGVPFSVLISGGADPWPYIQLTEAEQQAMVTGASASLIASVCALLGPETGGVGCGAGAAVIAMIVGIVVANGVCPDGREMRIYPLAGPTGFSCQ